LLSLSVFQIEWKSNNGKNQENQGNVSMKEDFWEELQIAFIGRTFNLIFTWSKKDPEKREEERVANFPSKVDNSENVHLSKLVKDN
jgi:hypothetical protein